MLVQLEFETDRAIPEGYIVKLRSGEILQGRTFVPTSDEPQIDLHPITQENAQFCITVTENSIDSEKGYKRIVDRRVDVDGEDVDIAAGVTATAQAAHSVKPSARASGTQVIDHGGRRGLSIGDEVFPRPAVPFVDRL